MHVNCWLVDFADLPVPEDAPHAPMPKRRCLDQSVPHSAHDTHIAPVPNCIKLAIGFAGDRIEEIRVDPRETIWTIAQSWRGEKAIAVREIRSNGNQIALDQLPTSVDGQVIRCFLVGVPEGAKQHIKSQLAQIPSKLVAPIVAQVVNAVPVSELTAIDGIDKHEALCTLARAHGINIPIPGHADRENKPAAIRPNNKGKGKGKHKVQSFELKDFRLDPSFFARSTGGDIGIASEISSNAAGVMIGTYDQLVPWLRTGKTLPDELGVILMKPPPQDCPAIFRVQAITFPAFDCAGRKFLLRGHLVQLGPNDIKLSCDELKTEVPETATIHLTSGTGSLKHLPSRSLRE